MTDKSVAIVTGANRGLGLETSRQLARLGHHVLMTNRNEVDGQAAQQMLLNEGLDVSYHPLDVRSEASVLAVVQHFRQHHKRLQILVNNAGIFPDPSPEDSASSIFNAEIENVLNGFDTNTLGPLRLCQALIPLMDGEGCVVNVSSGMGQLSEMGGCCPSYRLSKTALNALTRIFSEELKQTQIKINSICPGWVRTDMGGKEATLSIPEGVEGIIWAATLADDGPSGGFFRFGKPIEW
ncbi:MAG: SDR family oxidoreductase [Candidatus Thiodiazotropha sp. (ex Lucina aurantia)]|nr:SDR family oxidoreductase [Candidatus Thiodiazotropha sp. (ex Lucina pensylvanica)]MBT3023157.1 SDR family oxidoreductase [Candidatus Thiodiazotropha taylori]MBV2099105.1 SDR family oxidoreductase [Candidatus Thiodiazotropha sp. (ex Codakia orbicularis)]MBV2102934.1 SDR family oxidoreductase [Candidatus Thiodiazotropha sp. (ex Lucina aurantia)]MBV2117504.1 SDR family oxidoreductase [Candidatus Thiodiazotropha sp. (ex Lucina aurantia)]